nr:MAG: polymerase [Rhabdoviridae sp.]
MDWDLEEDQIWEDEWEDDGDEFTQKLSEFHHFAELNQTDYSLNSPLIPDEVVSFLDTALGATPSILHKTSSWDVRLAFLHLTKVDLAPCLSPLTNHEWWGDINGHWIERTNKIDHLLRSVARSHSITFPVIDSFLRGWIGVHAEPLTGVIVNIPRCVKAWGERYLEMHHITLILNAKTEREHTALSKLLSTQIIRTQEGLILGHIYQSHLYGVTHIFGGLVYFENHRRLLDRNFLLMMKDVYVARFQTEFGMLCRPDQRYKEEHVEQLEKLYTLGDLVLFYNGSEGYDVIKLLEPICNLRFCDLARSFRPLTPRFPAFALHVERTIQSVLHLHGADLFTQAILQLDRLDDLIVVYGSFRHWGHPYIEYETGLEKLYQQVTMKKDIDVSYAEALASDLAYLVLKKKFGETKQWFVDPEQMSRNHPFYTHIRSHTWPTSKQIDDFGDHWHELPLIKCFDIPDVVDPSLLYSDKSHSMTRSEVLEHVRLRRPGPIPTLKVLQTLLNTPATDWPKFLEQIEEEGLSREDLIIGLKAKEREIKRHGRFFSLMSWKLREYFVITEHLIKTHFVPLFNGLTMADDLTTVISKLLDRTQGQGGVDYKNICIANHIDYEKWNNHQRLEATGPVFRVMGSFLGYPNLIYRTHEFFQKSLIYYNGRPDLMLVSGDSLVCSSQARVCWEGQDGGLEGLRQKGWSILSLLVIQRESRIRNTRVKVLAQGDNQVICTQYKLRATDTPQNTSLSLQDIVRNNGAIMSSIKEGTVKLGLIINEDETMQSADYLNYGKIPVFRGRILNLFTKRLSRVMCTTNDQIPTAANIISTVSTNALTIAHFDTTPIAAMYYLDILSHFARIQLEEHNVVLGGSLAELFSSDSLQSLHYLVLFTYLDPSLGGMCGTSLARFLTRAFPDPVSEALCFWRVIYTESGDPTLQEIAKRAGNPPLSTLQEGGFEKLLESPSSLNIPRGLSLTNLLKGEIKKCLLRSAPDIKNQVISNAADYCLNEEPHLLAFLEGIKPLFPRFLSEFRSATFLGITDSLIGLFQNSRTIRTSFSRRLEKDLGRLVSRSELFSFHALLEWRPPGDMWTCSASHADYLRSVSWGRDVLGATVPHPLEMFGRGAHVRITCITCQDDRSDNYIATVGPLGLSKLEQQKGPYAAYLGSKTSESTSILQPWEKETNVSLIHRAAKLRQAINWFVRKESNLGLSILGVLTGLTGEEWDVAQEGFQRTGSALHRFGCSRVSAGGYAACAPTGLSWLVTTTDTLSCIGSTNYDFMFQTSILYAQISSLTAGINAPGSLIMHHHIQCQQCLRPIVDPVLDSDIIYEHPSVSLLLSKWKPESTPWGRIRSQYKFHELEARDIGPEELSYQIGRCEGFLYCDMAMGDNPHTDDSSLFPLTLQEKLIPDLYYEGLLDGIVRASALNVMHRRSIAQLKKPKQTLIGGVLHALDLLTGNLVFINFIRQGPLHERLLCDPHRTPPSYPISDADMGNIVRSWLKRRFLDMESRDRFYQPLVRRLCIFADMAAPRIIGPFLLSSKVMKVLFLEKLGKKELDELRSYREMSTVVRDADQPISTSVGPKDAILCPEEIRHASKQSVTWKTGTQDRYRWAKEFITTVESWPVSYASSPQGTDARPAIPQYKCPLISGLRLGQLATGAHYKVRGIIARCGLAYRDFICGGDGSGGMTSALLRWSPTSRCVFNTLMEYGQSSTRGTKPGSPPALAMGEWISSRCVNRDTIWEEPSDLSHPSAWISMKNHVVRSLLRVDLIVLDMEVREPAISSAIEENLIQEGFQMLEKHGAIIYKTYGTFLVDQPVSILDRIGGYFREVSLCQTGLSSSRTSEVYVVARGFLAKRTPEQHLMRKDLWNSLAHLACMKTEEEELSRACQVKPLDLLQGIPSELIPDLEVELCTFLGILGVSDGVASLMAREAMLTHRGLRLDTVWGIYLASGSAIINTTGEYMEDAPIPSDPVCEHVAVLAIGFMYWLAWFTKDQSLFRYTNNINDSSFTFGFIRKYTDRGAYRMSRLSWGVHKERRIMKQVPLHSSQAGIGQWIRLLARLDPRPKEADKGIIDVILGRYNRALNYTHIKRNSGLLCFRNLRTHWRSGSFITRGNIECEETAWRS